MKKFNSRSVSLVLFSLLLFFLSGCSATQPSFCPDGSSRCLKSLVGTYRGKIHNGGQPESALTSFYFNDQGKLVGTYFMNADTDAVKGEIVEFIPVGNYMALLKWKDTYGTGHLRALFSYDGQQFTGQWGIMSKLYSFPWDGTKTSLTPTTQLENQVKLDPPSPREVILKQYWEGELQGEDLDHDGVITLTEYQRIDLKKNDPDDRGAEYFFCLYDINSDRQVDNNEYLNAQESSHSIPAMQYCNYQRAIDYDKDGVFTLAEYEKEPINFSA